MRRGSRAFGDASRRGRVGFVLVLVLRFAIEGFVSIDESFRCSLILLYILGKMNVSYRLRGNFIVSGRPFLGMGKWMEIERMGWDGMA